MATEFRVPELGENIESGNVVKVLVSVGETIAQDQAVLELETDKAVLEVPVPVGGIVKEISVKEGEKVNVGQLILIVDENAAAKEEREEVKPDTKKADAEPGYKEREEAQGEPAVRREIIPRVPEEKVVEPGRTPQPTVQFEVSRQVAPAAPSVRMLARELGVDIVSVPGSGPAGRISIEDVKNYARRVVEEAASVRSDVPIPAAPLPDFTRWGEVERRPMSGVRRKTAEQMSYAWATIPHVTQFDKADITELEQLRKRFAEKAEASGGKLTVTAIVLKVVASALRAFPQFNASIDVDQSEIIYKRYYHIGVAVDTDRGLLVPVIRDVDKKNILGLSIDLTQVAERARNKKITVEEMQGGTFTITNLGGIGGISFTPIVNAPEVAILGISRAGMEPVFVNGQFEPRLMLPLSLSYDHRVIDGADAIRFLRRVVESLEQPFLLALEG